MLPRHLVLSVAALVVAIALPSCEAAEPVPARKRLFIIGQDLGAVRDYYASECCATPDGNTMYLNFYALVSKVGGYGGLGMDLEGNPIEQEMDWGAGPASAWKSATEVDGLREAGASKVEYVWQSAAFPLDILNDGGYTDIRQWYPGDDYVDWLGFSLFLNPDEGPAVNVDFQPSTGRELIGKVLDLARERSKPVFIGEASPQGYDLARRTNANIAPTWDGPQAEGVREVSDEDIWNEWFAPVFRLMEEHRDVIYALAYINVNWDSQDMWDAPYESGYWGDSRLQVNPYVAERFNQAIERWRSMD